MIAILPEVDRAALLQAARAALDAYAAGRRYAAPELTGGLAIAAAAFVTLRHHGELRGCTGWLGYDRPVGELVADLAVTSATRDPRFPPLRPDEVPDTKIEISVLSPPHTIQPDEVEAGTHGLIVQRGWYQGLLLPQVAREHGLGREEFLDATCLKAGLPREAWREPETVLLAFTAEVFGEHE